MTSFKEECSEYIKTGQSLSKQEDKVNFYIENIKECICNGGKIILCGNGGSAADSIHIAGEFVGRFKKDRKSLPAISLSAEVSSLTSIGNDYGFEYIFSRQVEGLGKRNDILISLSTSGMSVNILKAVEIANKKGLKTLSFSGKGGGFLANISNHCIVIESETTARIQEAQKFILHYICNKLEELLFDQN